LSITDNESESLFRQKLLQKSSTQLDPRLVRYNQVSLVKKRPRSPDTSSSASTSLAALENQPNKMSIGRGHLLRKQNES
jgi:hypothetical protein